MFTVQPIGNLDLPELAPYRTMRLQEEHRRQRIFVAEGEKVVRRLLESRLTVLSALMPESWFRQLEPLLAQRAGQVNVYLAEKRLLETLTGFSMYQGLLAVGRIPQAWTLDRTLTSTVPPRLLVAVDGLTSAENLGAVVRNCAAFGVHALVVGETCTSPYLRRAVRSSMGTVFHLPIVETTDLSHSLAVLRSRGIRCVAAHAHAQQQSLPSSMLTGDACIVLGSEGYGISPEVLQACDESVTIPMPTHVDSLNVGSAAAVFLYEANRQRHHYQNPASPLPWTTPDPTLP